MNLTKKRIIIYLLILLTGILLITAGFMKNRVIVTTAPVSVPDQDKSEIKNNLKTTAAKTSQKEKFTTNEEIKKEYGKLETVTLWNGKRYTGAVINTDEVYSIITIDGMIRIPMKDVKVRDIIR